MSADTNYLRGVDKLFENGRLKLYPKNQLIHYQGDPLNQIHLIKSGYIKAYTILDSGDTRTILLLGPGDIFPLAFSASLDWQDYQIKYFYQTLCDSEVTSLSSQALSDSMEDDAEQMKAYMNYLSASNQAIMSQLEVMKNKKAIDKLAMLLPYLVDKAGRAKRPAVYQLQLKLSHQELADLSGVTRETMTSLVKELETDGILDQKKGYWEIDLSKIETLTPAG